MAVAVVPDSAPLLWWAWLALVGVAEEYEATLSKEHVSVDLQSPLPEKPDVRLGDMTPWDAAVAPPAE